MMNSSGKRRVWRVSLGASAVALAACGGGIGEIIAVLGYAGAGGGTYSLDGNPATAKLDTVRTCGAALNSPCQITLNVQGNTTAPFPNPLFDHSYGVSTAGPGELSATTRCNSAFGTVSERRLDIPNCFNGSYQTVDKVVSDDGTKTLLFSYQADYLQGAWYDIRNDKYRLKFTQSTPGVAPTAQTAAGCEINDTVKTTRVEVDYLDTDLANGVLAAVAQVRFRRPGIVAAEVWSAEMVGASGLRLTRGGQTLELERRRGSAAADSCA